MKLSIIIVNYNVQFFLEQCLLSVQNAIRHVETEVFVVDNNSVDGSVAMVRAKFPWVKLIANTTNDGFSKANNQAMRLAVGEYVLLLNPDTVVEERTFDQVVAFMDAHPDAGGLGVKMVDGKGKFLPESKRGLPTPWVAFYKIFGLSRIFPKSTRFNAYYMGHLSNDQIAEIEILSGAFMLMRKKALDEVGLLDEAFFMYGEDIDLSWRIIQGGYKNYYFPDTTIIHYKGESTKKGSLNYVFVFYNAMIIFARKHFSQKNASLFTLVIQVAIWLRAGAAIVYRFIKSLLLPAWDIGLTFGLMLIAKDYYAQLQDKIYDPDLVLPSFGAFILVWCFAVWLGGGYDKPWKPFSVLKPIIVGTIVILTGYSLLPESLRFSRALVLLGVPIAMAVFFVGRVVFNLLTTGKSGLYQESKGSVAIIGEEDETERVKQLLALSGNASNEYVRIAPNHHSGSLRLDQLPEIVRINKLEQIIYCGRDVSSARIIQSMSELVSYDLEFKIAPPESLFIIGSNSIESTGDVFISDINSVSLQSNLRIKRTFDVALAIVLLIGSPIFGFMLGNPVGLARNAFMVLIGKSSWVGFDFLSNSKLVLPALRKGVLTPTAHLSKSHMQDEQVEKLNLLYAKDYRITNDLSLVWKARRMLVS